MAESKKKSSRVLKNWKDMRKEVEGILNSSSLKEAQGNVKKFVSNAESDLKNVMEKDLPDLAKKIREEKKSIEKMVDKAVQTEVKRALSFVSEHKKDLDDLQKKVEGYLYKSSSTGSGQKKKTTKKKAAKKSGGKKKKTSKKSSSSKKSTKKNTKKSTKKKSSQKSGPQNPS